MTIACLTRCDPGSTFTYEIQNNSTHQIVVDLPVFGPEEIILNPGETRTEIDGQLGSHKYLKNDVFKESYCPCAADSSSITVKDTSFVLLKDVHDCDSWTHSDKKMKFQRGGEFKCTFIINDADIHTK